MKLNILTKNNDVFVFSGKGRIAQLIGHRLFLLPSIQKCHCLVNAL